MVLFRIVLLAGLTGGSLITPATYPVAKLLVYFNAVDILAKVLFKDSLKEIKKGALGLCSGNTSHG